MTLEQARAVLELPEIFTSAELKRAYRDSLLVWHPDRFEGNHDLKAKATAKTQEINRAYALLRTVLAEVDHPKFSTTDKKMGLPEANLIEPRKMLHIHPETT